MDIRKTAIVGLGALGILYADLISRNIDRNVVRCLMDPVRLERGRNADYRVNGHRADFMLADGQKAEPADLIIVATKYSGLQGAMDIMAKAVGPDTTIISVMNGITSETMLAERFGTDRVLGCVALGMDAVRDGTALTYAHPGKLQIGAFFPTQEQRAAETIAWLRKAGVVVEEKSDIRRALWNKFMLNVGINQTCMVYQTGYGGALHGAESRPMMEQAMREVIVIANAESVCLTEEDLQGCITLLLTLDREAAPSMRQDALAHRKTEVPLFAGTVLQYGEKHNIPTPVNRYYAQRIAEMEQEWA